MLGALCFFPVFVQSSNSIRWTAQQIVIYCDRFLRERDERRDCNVSTRLFLYDARFENLSGLPNRVDGLVYLIGTYPEISTTFIDREIEYLEENGFALRVLSIRPPDGLLSDEQLLLQCKVNYLLPVNWRALVSSHLYFSITRPLQYWRALFFLLTRPHPNLNTRWKTILHFGEGVYAAGVLRASGVRHIHAHFIDRAAIVAWVASRLLDVSYSVTAHANDIFVEPVLLGEKLRYAKFAITVSQYNKTHLLEQIPELDPNQLVVILAPPNFARFIPPPRIATTARHLLAVGRLVEQKGHADLIRACARLREEQIDFECHIVGEGPLRGELENLIQQCGLSGQIKLLGAQSSARVFQEYQWADVFVLACAIGSDGSRDGIPAVLEEAMVMELPIITTNVVGLRERVSPETAVLVPPNDPRALADALKTMLELDADARQAIGRRAREIVLKHFADTQPMEQLAELFRAALMKC